MSNRFPHPFSDLARKYRGFMNVLPKEVSVIALNEFKGHFRAGGYYGSGGALVKWKKRAHDEKGGKRALLIKTGRLRRGLQTAPRANSARVINDVPYAAIHNEGGRINTTVNVRAYRNKYGNKVKGHQRKVNMAIPARPFMIDTPRLTGKIDKHIEAGLNKLFQISRNA